MVASVEPTARVKVRDKTAPCRAPFPASRFRRED
jgi:hypothetical protein